MQDKHVLHILLQLVVAIKLTKESEVVFVPAGLDDAADVVENGHGPLPAGQQVQGIRRFLRIQPNTTHGTRSP
jgi:hypothetical protein